MSFSLNVYQNAVKALGLKFSLLEDFKLRGQVNSFSRNTAIQIRPAYLWDLMQKCRAPCYKLL